MARQHRSFHLRTALILNTLAAAAAASRCRCAQELDFPTPEVMVQQCGKLALMDRLLKRLHANGHKVLIFSQVGG